MRHIKVISIIFTLVFIGLFLSHPPRGDLVTALMINFAGTLGFMLNPISLIMIAAVCYVVKKMTVSEEKNL